MLPNIHGRTNLVFFKYISLPNYNVFLWSILSSGLVQVLYETQSGQLSVWWQWVLVWEDWEGQVSTGTTNQWRPAENTTPQNFLSGNSLVVAKVHYWWAKTSKFTLKDIIILWLKDVITKKVYISQFSWTNCTRNYFLWIDIYFIINHFHSNPRFSRPSFSTYFFWKGEPCSEMR